MPDATPPAENAPPELPSIQELFVSTGLYKDYSWLPAQKNSVGWYLHPAGSTIDSYCGECGSASVFRGLADEGSLRLWHAMPFKGPRTYLVYFQCSRNPQHTLTFAIHVQEGKFRKIGQYPSFADLSADGLGEYRRLLGPERFREFSRGIGLAAHGVGIGSFVYLRRIFEWLMEEAFRAAKDSGEVNEEAYRPVRMEEKILLLQRHLPEFMVRNRRMYSILGKGIHELSEEECVEFFATLRSGIEVILDERLAEQRRRFKVEAAERRLGELDQRLAQRE